MTNQQSPSGVLRATASEATLTFPLRPKKKKRGDVHVASTPQLSPSFGTSSTSTRSKSKLGIKTAANGARLDKNGKVIPHSILGSVVDYERAVNGNAAALAGVGRGFGFGNGTRKSNSRRSSSMFGAMRKSITFARNVLSPKGGENPSPFSVDTSLNPSRTSISEVFSRNDPGSPTHSKDEYFDIIRKQLAIDTQHNQKIADEIIELENKEKIKSLLMHEKIMYDRQARALALWEKWQKEWSGFKTSMSKQLKKSQDDLVVSRAEQYREVLEEYDVMWAATPLQLRHGSDYWTMSLRGHGTRYVAVGNIFSGLFCPINEDTEKDLTVIRKPRDRQTNGLVEEERPKQDNTQLVKTWRDAPALARRRRELGHHMHRVRKHLITQERADNLQAVGCDLFEWSTISTEKFLLEVEQAEDGDLEQAPVLDDATEASSTAAQLKEQVDVIPKSGVSWTIARQPDQFGNPVPRPSGTPDSEAPYVDVLLETVVGAHVQTQAYVANTGTTALYYEWVPAPLPDRVKTFLDIKDAEQSAEYQTLADQRFVCLAPKGVLLPDEHRCFTFSFHSTSPGTWSQTWTLATVPLAPSPTYPQPAGEPTVCRFIELCGVANQPDFRAPVRKEIQVRLTNKAQKVDMEENQSASTSGDKLRNSDLDGTQLPGSKEFSLEESSTETLTSFDNVFELANRSLGLVYNSEAFLKLKELAHQTFSLLHLQEIELPSNNSSPSDAKQLAVQHDLKEFLKFPSIASLRAHLQRIVGGQVLRPLNRAETVIAGDSEDEFEDCDSVFSVHSGYPNGAACNWTMEQNNRFEEMVLECDKQLLSIIDITCRRRLEQSPNYENFKQMLLGLADTIVVVAYECSEQLKQEAKQHALEMTQAQTGASEPVPKKADKKLNKQQQQQLEQEEAEAEAERKKLLEAQLARDNEIKALNETRWKVYLDNPLKLLVRQQIREKVVSAVETLETQICEKQRVARIEQLKEHKMKLTNKLTIRQLATDIVNQTSDVNPPDAVEQQSVTEEGEPQEKLNSEKQSSKEASTKPASELAQNDDQEEAAEEAEVIHATSSLTADHPSGVHTKLTGKRVMIRADLDIPPAVDDHQSLDMSFAEEKITKLISTINIVIQSCPNQVVVIGHRGGILGEKASDSEVRERLSMRLVAEDLSDRLGREVVFFEDCVGDEALSNLCHELAGGDGENSDDAQDEAPEQPETPDDVPIYVLENLGFYKEEFEFATALQRGMTLTKIQHAGLSLSSSTRAFQRKLISMADVFVNDSLTASYMGASSTLVSSQIAGRPILHVAGEIVRQDMNSLAHILENPGQAVSIVVGDYTCSTLDAYNSTEIQQDMDDESEGIAESEDRLLQHLKLGSLFTDRLVPNAFSKQIDLISGVVEHRIASKVFLTGNLALMVKQAALTIGPEAYRTFLHDWYPSDLIDSTPDVLQKSIDRVMKYPDSDWLPEPRFETDKSFSSQTTSGAMDRLVSIIEDARQCGIRFYLPRDVVVVPRHGRGTLRLLHSPVNGTSQDSGAGDEGASRSTEQVNKAFTVKAFQDTTSNDFVLGIGEQTVRRWTAILKQADCVVLADPCGRLSYNCSKKASQQLVSMLHKNATPLSYLIDQPSLAHSGHASSLENQSSAHPEEVDGGGPPQGTETTAGRKPLKVIMASNVAQRVLARVRSQEEDASSILVSQAEDKARAAAVARKQQESVVSQLKESISKLSAEVDQEDNSTTEEQEQPVVVSEEELQEQLEAALSRLVELEQEENEVSMLAQQQAKSSKVSGAVHCLSEPNALGSLISTLQIPGLVSLNNVVS